MIGEQIKDEFLNHTVKHGWGFHYGLGTFNCKWCG